VKYRTMPKIIACELAPNYQFKDALIALKSVLALPFTAFGGSNNLKKCKAWFANYFSLEPNQDKQIYFTDSGRTALYLLLKSLNLPIDSQVLVQSFSCVVVPNSVSQAGLKPIVCDINLTDLNFDFWQAKSKITPKTKVWIVQHNLGIVSPDFQKIKKLCHQQGITLIEDCAHCLGAESLQNPAQKVGTLGDASIFSFGRDKVVSSTIGGAVMINKDVKSWKQNLQKEYQKLRQMPLDRELRSLIYPILMLFTIKPLYYWFVGKIVLVVARKLKILEPVYTLEEKRGTSKPARPSHFSDSLARVLHGQLKRFDKFKYHRRQLAQFYSKELYQLRDQIFFPVFHKNCSYLRFPIVFKTPQQKNKVYQALRANKIIPGTWYTASFLPTDFQKNQRNKNILDLDQITNTQQVCQKILNLPTNINTSLKDAQKIIKIIKSCFYS